MKDAQLTFFTSKKCYKEMLAAIRRNDSNMRTVIFHNITFKQLKELAQHIEGNSSLLSIRLPSQENPSIYGEGKTEATIKLNNIIMNKVAENLENTQSRNRVIVFSDDKVNDLTL
uniref:Uncharacterized protein n=2 Tax=viral metagenome TaxID=1070528 RepID=A0A6M3J3G8_9ZZZZ